MLCMFILYRLYSQMSFTNGHHMLSMFTIFYLWLAYVHHVSHMFTIGHLWLRYGHHMSPMLNVYYICILYIISCPKCSPYVTYIHKMSSIFTIYVMSCDMSPYVTCVYVSSILLCITYIYHMSSHVVICLPYVTYVYYI